MVMARRQLGSDRRQSFSNLLRACQTLLQQFKKNQQFAQIQMQVICI
jgi:hypothetical protein